MNATIKEILYDASLTVARLQRNIRACQLERGRNELYKCRRELDGAGHSIMLAMNTLATMDMDCKVFNVNIKETKDDNNQL